MKDVEFMIKTRSDTKELRHLRNFYLDADTLEKEDDTMRFSGLAEIMSLSMGNRSLRT